MFQIDGDPPGVRVQRFFLKPAFFQQTKPGRCREVIDRFLADPRRLQSQLGQHLVEVVSSDGWDTLGRDHVVHVLVESHERSIERTAAQVVHEDRFQAGFALPFTVTEFDAGSARLI